jgi:hypothetical protein
MLGSAHVPRLCTLLMYFKYFNLSTYPRSTIKASISKSQTFPLAERAFVSYRCASVRTAAGPGYAVPCVQAQVTSLLITKLCSKCKIVFYIQNIYHEVYL